MRATLNAIANRIDAFNQTLGAASLWIVLAMMLAQILIIGFLFLFSEGSLWLQESILYMHAAYIALLLGYTFLHDAHVRIDIFYRNASPKQKALINLAGALLFLLPFCALIIFTASPYALASWRIWEGSREASGIQAVYLLKTLIIIAALSLGIQSISAAIRAALTLSQKAEN